MKIASVNQLIAAAAAAVALVALFATTSEAKAPTAETPVEVVEIREVGISPNDESKSVVELRWRANPALSGRAAAYRLQVAVFYADGTSIVLKDTAGPDETGRRFEVPSARISPNRPPAFLKRMKAVVTAVTPAPVKSRMQTTLKTPPRTHRG